MMAIYAKIFFIFKKHLLDILQNREFKIKQIEAMELKKSHRTWGRNTRRPLFPPFLLLQYLLGSVDTLHPRMFLTGTS